MKPFRGFLLLVVPVLTAGVLLLAFTSLWEQSWRGTVGDVAFYLLVSVPFFAGLAGFLVAKARRWLWGILAALVGVALFYIGFFMAMAIRVQFGMPI